MSDGVKAAILEETVQTCYEKAASEACPGECASWKTVIHYAHGKEDGTPVWGYRGNV